MRTSRNVAAELAHTFSTRAGEIPASLREESRRKNEGEKERFLSIEREKRGERPWKIKSIKQGEGEDSSTQCSGTDQRFITSRELRTENFICNLSISLFVVRQVESILQRFTKAFERISFYACIHFVRVLRIKSNRGIVLTL